MTYPLPIQTPTPMTVWTEMCIPEECTIDELNTAVHIIFPNITSGSFLESFKTLSGHDFTT